jgi:signal transduction histidine kinase
MSLTGSRSGAREWDSWIRPAPIGFSASRALPIVVCATSVLVMAWMTLDGSPPGAPAAVFLSSVGMVVFWAQLIRSEHEQGRRAEADTVAALGRVLGALGPGCTPRHAFATAFRELSRLTGVRTALAAMEHRGSGRLLVLTVSLGPGGDVLVRVRRVPRAHRGRYFSAPHVPPSPFGDGYSSRGMSVYEFAVRDHWAGRLFLPRADRGHLPRPDLEALIQQAVCALAATRDLPRIRRRAAARERARLGRELHDGVVQELATLDVELEILKRPARVASPAIESSVADIQARLRAQVRDLRLIEEQARAYEVEPSRLPAVLAHVVARFRRDSGIEATCALAGEGIELPPRVCGEIVRIVQEALVNVRRHSGARRVAVRFARADAGWTLSVEDDGRGLRTWGTGASPGGRPAVIEERVQSIGGTLRVAPGVAGARLEIAVARGDSWVSRTFESC